MAWQHRANTRLCHADLLELYLQQPDDFERLAEGLGFEKKKIVQNENHEPTKQTSDKTEVTDNKSLAVKVTSCITDRPEIPFYYVARRERTANHLNPAKPEVPQWLVEAEALVGDAIYDKNAARPKIQALTRTPKLWGQLRNVLKQSYATQEPDIAKIIKKITKGESLHAIPFTQKKRRISQVLVLADNAKHLKTTQSDYQKLYQGLINLWGKQKIQWQSIVDHPMGKVRCYKNRQYKELPWRIPASDTAIIILSDCGSLGEQQNRQQWQVLLKQLNRQNRLTFILAPADVQDLQSISFKGLNAFSWDSYLPKIPATYCPEFSRESANQRREDVENILTHLAFCYRIEPGLLRATRLQLGLKVSAEAHFRLHPDVKDDGQFIYIKSQALDKYRIRFKLLDQKQKNQSINWVRYYHARLPRSILDQELVNAQQLCSQKITGADESLHYLQRLSKTFSQQPKQHLLRCWSYDYLQEQELGKTLAAAFFASLYKDEIEQGQLEALTLPRNVELHDLKPYLKNEQQNKHYRIQQVKDTLQLQPVEAESKSGFTLAETVCTQKYFKQRNKLVSVFSGCHLVIESEALDASLSIDTGTEILTLGRLIKPEWAINMGRDQQGLFIEYQQGEKINRLYYPFFGGEIQKNQYGLYTDLSIKNIRLRFRYVEPGTFLMGSPEDEPEREVWAKETQHQVTLTEGFWLADTTVTQALYQAIMDTNPSHFKEDINNPVEQVSWDAAQQFIKKLNALIPALHAQLPTEAQWEYACRAGTTGPFSFGDNITSEQVNYNGNYPYAGSKKGVSRKKTVAVKSLPANSWGLYEMHGNVWEWCGDVYQEDLSKNPVIDPRGTGVGAMRVIRGGSWGDDGGDVRSAMRSGGGPGDRSYDAGFRLSLGLELQTGQEQPDSQQGHSRRDGASEPAGGQGAGHQAK